MGQYADLFDDAGDQVRASANLRFGIEAKPDLAASDAALAKRYGVPAGVIEQYRPDYEARAKVEDAAPLLEQSPRLRGWLAEDAGRAKVAHDDLTSLAGIETAIAHATRYVMGADGKGGLPGDAVSAVRSFASGLQSAGAGLYGTAAAPFEMLGANGIGGWLLDRQKRTEGVAKAWQGEMSEDAGLVRRGVMSGFQSAGQNLALLPLGLVGGEALMLGTMGATTYGQTYGKARNAGLSPGQASVYGAEDATAEVITEKFFGAAGLLSRIKAGSSAGKLFGYEVAKEVPGEIGATLWQNLNEWGNVNPDKSVADWVNEQPAAIGETIIATLVGGGAQIGAVKAIERAVLGAERQTQRAQQAEHGAQQLQQLMELAKASKLAQRAPDSFEQFVNDATQDGPLPNVFIAADALMQSGLADAVAQASPVVAQQMQVALATGGDIRIPTGELLARIAPLEEAKPLVDHLKTEPGGWSRIEAQDRLKAAVEEMQQDADRRAQEHQGDETFKASQEAVKAEIRAQLDSAGRFTPQAHDAYATLAGSFYAVQAARLGITPQELYQRYPLRVAAQGVVGEALNQFAGDGAATANHAALSTAQQRLAAGEDAEAVRKATGWHQGADGKWRYEISDADARLLRKSSSEEFANVYEEAAARPDGVPLSRVLVHPALFAAYPQLGDVRVVIDDAMSGDGAYYPASRTIKLRSPDGYRGGSLRLLSVLLHEIQHGIQSVEGFASGGSIEGMAALMPSSPVDGYRRLAGEVEARNTQARADMTDAERAAASPEDTADVPRNNVIVVFNGAEMASAPPPANAAPAAPRAAYSPSTNTISLLKAADLSSFLHEAGHAFLEMHFDMAARLDGAQREGAGLSEGELQVLADANAVLQWFGVEDFNAWYAMDFEQRRGLHERFAESFEAYLFSGRAPSIELQAVFQRFRAWLLSVYKSLKDFLAGHPEAGKLTDDVRGVFDRMLATTEQIKLAEQGRSMLPLFSTAQDAGMTPEEFAAYQALGVDATNEAIQELQAKGLQDMQWLARARGRVLRRLQRQAAEQRREVRMEARAEVLQQPVYRAWQFLTGKIAEVDKLEPVAAPRPAGGALDAANDSLLVAIAKLGGIARESARTDLGVAADDLKRGAGVFGKPPFRKEGGLTAERMAEALQEQGYLPSDYTLHDLEERVGAELQGRPQYSDAHDYAVDAEAQRRPGEGYNLGGLTAGRLDLTELRALGLPPEMLEALQKRRMTAKEGIAPDLVAELFGFTSGDELARALATAQPLGEAVEAATDARMLERFGELATPAAIEQAADAAVHNEVRARMIATEQAALARAVSGREQTGTDRKGRPTTQAIVPRAAREFAQQLIARLKIRDIRPAQYDAAESRAARNAEAAARAGKLDVAAAEKRNQLIQHYSTKAAYEAQEDVEKGLRYLRGFDREGTRKSLDSDYLEQIDALLERFDLRAQSLKAIDKRKALATWLESQREAGIEPDIPEQLKNEAFRKSYKDLTVEEWRGLVDSVKQIEHLARLKHRLLTARDQRAYEAIRDDIAAGIVEHAGERKADTRTPTTNAGRFAQGLRRFWAAHIKVATLARVMDGGKDGGPVWEHFVRSANERSDREATMRAEATQALSDILAPVFKQGRMGGKGQFFPSIGRSLNREARLAIALNVGNEGNLQRLLGGEGWTREQLVPVLQSLTAAEWKAVQAIWDHFESYRPEIAAKEKRVYGKEPQWVEPTPLNVVASDGTELRLRGGYYPIKYDPQASQRAEEHADAEGAKRQLQGAYTSATTRRSFTKSRTEEVTGRPLLYTLAGLYSGVNDVLHDLQWHEWLIDVNRLLRSQTIDSAMREHYGPEAKAQFKSWVQAIAEGDKGSDAAVDQALARLRQGISAAGLGFNVMSAAMQPLGLTQSIVRVGARYVGHGLARYIAGPRALAREVNERSEFMANRARTRFRELNELRNQVQDQHGAKERIGVYAYWLMMQAQRMVDLPTWEGAYQKAVVEGHDEERAIALADQAVRDAQGGGQTSDLSAIERGGPAQKLFTVFYSFMNTALNLGVAQTMTAEATPRARAKLAADYLLLFVVPAVLGAVLKDALQPGGDDDEDWAAFARRMLAAELDYLMGLMVVVREFGEAAKIVTGANDRGRDYTGPAGLRLIADTITAAKQVHQAEFDDALRKSLVNVAGDLTGLPAAQVNKTVTGAKALAEGETSNPAALAFGFQRQ